MVCKLIFSGLKIMANGFSRVVSPVSDVTRGNIAGKYLEK